MKKNKKYTTLAIAMNKSKDNIMNWNNPEFTEHVKNLLEEGFEPFDSVSHGDAVILFFRK